MQYIPILALAAANALFVSTAIEEEGQAPTGQQQQSPMLGVAKLLVSKSFKGYTGVDPSLSPSALRRSLSINSDHGSPTISPLLRSLSINSARGTQPRQYDDDDEPVSPYSKPESPHERKGEPIVQDKEKIRRWFGTSGSAAEEEQMEREHAAKILAAKKYGNGALVKEGKGSGR